MTQRAQWASALFLAFVSSPASLAAQPGAVEIWMRAFIPGPGNADGERESILETKFSLIPTGRGTAIVSPETQRTSGRVEKEHIGTPTLRDGAAHVTGQVIGENANYSFDLAWRPIPGELNATLSVGTFPAYEMFARSPGQQWVEVVRSLPTAPPGDESFTQ